jgi:hypothetical protein
LESIVFMQVSNRQAEEEREQRFESLADFANMGDDPRDWGSFCSKHPHFFPQVSSGSNKFGFRNLTEWIYAAAYEWAKTMEEVARPEVRAHVLTPLLWYRNRVRAFWTRNDPEGINLMVLLGFEKEALEKAKTVPGALLEQVMRPFLVPGQPNASPWIALYDPATIELGERVSIGGLPRGRRVEIPDDVEGLSQGQPTVHTSGRIEWTFGCTLQQAVSELNQCRWRAKMCPDCSKYFVAKKTAQKHCSTTCYREKKQRQALEFYYREGGGKDRREERRAFEEKSKKRKP